MDKKSDSSGISLENICFRYPTNKSREWLFSGFSLEIPSGSRYCLQAASGRGKTTLLRIILGLETPQKGKVTIPDGTRFAAVFQEDRLLPYKSALENAALFATMEDAAKMLTSLGIMKEEQSFLPSELSGGMRRRVALARALCSSFDVLVLDEPFTGLDTATRELCFEETKLRSKGKTLLLSSHAEGEAEALSASLIRL